MSPRNRGSRRDVRAPSSRTRSRPCAARRRPARARRAAPRRRGSRRPTHGTAAGRGDRAPRVVGGRVRELGEDRAVGRAVRFYRCVVACRRGGAVDVERRRRAKRRRAARLSRAVKRCMFFCSAARHAVSKLLSVLTEFRTARAPTNGCKLAREEQRTCKTGSGRQLFI